MWSAERRNPPTVTRAQRPAAGTVERLAPEAIVASHNGTDVREVLLLTECKFFDDCTFRYHGVEMRGDGESFELRLHTVRTCLGRLSALSVLYSKLCLYGAEDA